MIKIKVKPNHLELISRMFSGKPIMPRETKLEEFGLGKPVGKKNIFSCRIVEKNKKGKRRIIYIPSPRLKKIQRKILKFLKKIWSEWHANYCGMHHGSAFTHAFQHENSRYIFQFDIKDAFPSVNTELLRKLLLSKISQNLKYYNEDVKRYKFDKDRLEKVLKKEPRDAFFIEREEEWFQKSIKDVIFSPFYPIFGSEKVRMSSARTLTDAIMAFATFNNILPQGTPTAPFLFYVYLVENHCIDKVWVPEHYASCYVDGFVISGNEPLPAETKKKILKSLEDIGLKANETKTRDQDCRCGAATITGLAVDGSGKVRLPRKMIKRWRGMINQAAHETDSEKKKELTKRIRGFVASLKPIYGENIPRQIAKPLEKLTLSA